MSWGERSSANPDLSPQGVLLAMRAGSVVIAAAIGASAATKNVVQRAGRSSDAGSDRGASADVRMRASADAGTRCSANRRAGQSSTAAACKRQQAEAANRHSHTFEKIAHGSPPKKRTRKTCSMRSSEIRDCLKGKKMVGIRRSCGRAKMKQCAGPRNVTSVWENLPV